MNEQTATELEKTIYAASARFVEELKPLSSSPYIQEGIVQEAIASFAWDLYHAFPDARHALHDQLGSMGMAVQSAIRNEPKS